MSLTRPLVLASTSPRRQFLMAESGLAFRVEKPDADESFSNTVPVTEVPRYLASKKASKFKSSTRNEIFITADTVVILDNQILNKPLDRPHAIEMLTLLSGRTHLVITAVCLLGADKEVLFDEHTNVTFNKLRPEDILAYVDDYQPFDKAGAYGAQECLPEGFNPCSAVEIEFLRRIKKEELIAKSITRRADQGGMNAIKQIDGSYFNVMGLPVHRVHEELERF